MGGRRGWLSVPAFVGLAILFAVPTLALDVGVDWSLENVPTVATLGATDVSQNSAILRGSLGGLGGEPSVEVSFEWGTSPAFGQDTAPETLAIPGIFEASVGQLAPDTAYYYRAKAAGNGTAVGETLSFQTIPAAAAGDLFSQLWFWLVLAAVAGVLGFFITRKQMAARRKSGEPGAAAQKAGRTKKTRGGLFAKAGGILAVGKRSSKAPSGDVGRAGTGTRSKVLCPHCGTELLNTAVYCYGCGRGVSEGVDLDERVERARGRLADNERDRDALFTVGAHLAATGEGDEAIEVLNKLSMLDPAYPGLWWVKARVFETLGNSKAAEAAMVRAMGADESAGVEALLSAAGTAGATGTVSEPTPVAPKSPEAQERAEGKTAPDTCPHCSSTLELEAGNCPSCGHSVLDQGEALEAKVTRALAVLDLDENDADALFTLGAYLLLDGKVQESLDTLNRLTLIDSSYPGLWWVKAQVFEKLGNKQAAESALTRARQGDEALEGDG